MYSFDDNSLNSNVCMEKIFDITVYDIADILVHAIHAVSCTWVVPASQFCDHELLFIYKKFR